jgi:hypothetical protein
MRFLRPHPAFQLLFGLSIIALVVGFFLAITSSDACVSSTGSSRPDPKCGLDAGGRQAGGVAVAIGGLALMIGGVGFQVGRSAPSVPAPQQAMFPPGPPAGGPPQHGQQQGFGQPGQWGPPPVDRQ